MEAAATADDGCQDPEYLAAMKKWEVFCPKPLQLAYKYVSEIKFICDRGGKKPDEKKFDCSAEEEYT